MECRDLREGHLGNVWLPGTSKSCVTVAMGVMLNILSLHVSVNKTAYMGSLRLLVFGSLRSGDLKIFLWIANIFADDPVVRISDRILTA